MGGAEPTVAVFDEVLTRFTEAVLELEAFNRTHDTLGGFWKEERAKLQARIDEKRQTLIEAFADTVALAVTPDADLVLNSNEHSFGAGWDAALKWVKKHGDFAKIGQLGSSTCAKHDAWSEYDPPEEFKGRW